MAKSAQRRADRARMIARRRFIIDQTWWSGSASGGREPFVVFPVSGMLDKYNLVCSSAMCRGERYRDDRPHFDWRAALEEALAMGDDG